MTVYDLMIISPEIILFMASMLLLILGLSNCFLKYIPLLGFISLISTTFYLNYFTSDIIGESDYIGIYVSEETIMWKGILLFIGMAIIALFSGISEFNKSYNEKYEFIFILILSIIGGMIAISASNILVLFVALELMALAGYVFACFEREKLFSVEAGMKYFILGALATSIMVFGMSFIYGFSNSLAYIAIYRKLVFGGVSTGIVFGSVLFLLGMLFKLSIFPFHFWTADIYQGSPLISLGYFTSIPKYVNVIVLTHLMKDIFYPFKSSIDIIMLILGILSIAIGSFGALTQVSFKRLLGYSTVMNMGFVLTSLSIFSSFSYQAAIIYTLIYSGSTIGLIATIAISSDPDKEDYLIDDFMGFGKVKKIAALVISIFMFSLAGIPPLAGFFAKYMIILSLVQEAQYITSVFVVFFSVIGAYYYINVIRVIYFNLPSANIYRGSESRILRGLIFSAILFVILLPLIAGSI